MSAPAPPTVRGSYSGLVASFLCGAAVAASLGVYAGVHTPASRPLLTLGFSGVLQMKAWLSTLVLVLVVVQLATALTLWGKVARIRVTAASIAMVHRWSGSLAFALSLPVAFHCIWSLGFQTTSTRVVVHGIGGCAFYGAYAAKMLGLRVRKLPSWA